MLHTLTLTLKHHFTLVITGQDCPDMFSSNSKFSIQSDRENSQSNNDYSFCTVYVSHKYQEGGQSTVEKLVSVNIFQQELRLVYISHPKVYRGLNEWVFQPISYNKHRILHIKTQTYDTTHILKHKHTVLLSYYSFHITGPRF